MFITHQLLPHSHSANHLHYPRIITNPHVSLKEDLSLNREDGQYVSDPASKVALTKQTLCEQVILRALGRQSISEWRPTRERLAHYPRTAYFKRARIEQELDRLAEQAKVSGQSVDSIYLKDEAAILEHEKRNGYNLDYGPNGVMSSQQENTNDTPGSDVDAVKIKQTFRVGRRG